MDNNKFYPDPNYEKKHLVIAGAIMLFGVIGFFVTGSYVVSFILGVL